MKVKSLKYFVLLASLLLAQPAHASFSIVQSLQPTATSATSRTFVYASDNATGNLLLLCINFATAPLRDVTSVTDTAGNTWTQIGTEISVPTNDQGLVLYQVATSVSGANTVTVAVSGSAGNIWGTLLEVHSGGARTLDAGLTLTSNTADTTVATQATTALHNGSLFFGFFQTPNVTVTADSGWTAITAATGATLLYNLSVASGASTASGTCAAAREANRSVIWSEAGGSGNQVSPFLVGP